jgi:Domain of unknown function (DUF4157)
VQQALKSPGRPLEVATRAFMGPRFAAAGTGTAARTAPGGPTTKLSVGAPNDAHEREADTVAAQITRVLPGAPAMRRAGGSADGSRGVSGHDCHSCGGQAATGGYDFSGVRVHTDRQAAESARVMNADAYTVGQHVFFAEGKYDPHNSTGRNLLAHELTHVVQQSPRDHASESATGGATVQHRLASPAVQGKWRLDSITPRGKVEGSRIHENGNAAGYSFVTSVHGNTEAWQEQGWFRTEVGGEAQDARWVTLQYVFTNDRADRDFLHLVIDGQVFGNAKAEDLDHARAAGMVWGGIIERTAANLTPPARQLFTPLEEGGISAATIGELGTIEVDLPLGDVGSVHATFPLTKVKQGSSAPFSESTQPVHDVSPDIDIVDVFLGARVESDASIESSYALFATLDENRSSASASFNLDWKNRSSPAPRPDTGPGGGASGVPGAARKIRAQAICKCVGDDSCGGGKIHRKYFEVEDCRDAKLAAEKICNNDPEMKEKCIRPKCYYRHGDYKCPA